MKIDGLHDVLKQLEIEETNYGASDGHEWFGNGAETKSVSPINGQVIAKVKQANKDDYDRMVEANSEAFKIWREMPAPKRGEIVRQFGLALREKKDALGRMVTIEMGKSLQEGWGEVQEMIDICDYATGLSRMLYGKQTHSERFRHRMYEQWHPLGVVGIISAFNFPVAVWSWNLGIALACGDTCMWKPASHVPLTAIACQKIMMKVIKDNDLPPGISTLLIGRGSEVGELMLSDKRMNLVSYTGSTKIGRHIGAEVTKRFGKTILELGGNNAVIVTPHAEMELAAKAILFGAVGTAGQRCTSTRRVIVEKSRKEELIKTLKDYYGRVTIGNPLDQSNLMGPLVDTGAVDMYLEAIEIVKKQGGKMLWGGEKLDHEGGCYVTPSVAEVKPDLEIVCEETFAPLLYIIEYSGDIQKAIDIQNNVPQGLSSSIFTNDLIESETFLGHTGSDCGIANVNVGTSGAEIGLAFGGEKETGGGRESGSDSWKMYMRRQSNTINWSGKAELAQGIKFD
ncbi:MAG: aldehyde dehydrogenase family protein [candidate division Zixibacteria bacterium]|nr:aldehyde dehydrogenase family protein [candidate division Zixibacteria bacterium]NIR62625.1 aldehyde dehydrogenase family protein [candidate division Zixibacteria bacterium]NIS15452.1 aldehyde dehydrogenase family protein [candidate division Zixibacteria bacterium]NIS46271.1 aldehyde dehydrogenase family protein [candidate division Zixibacteria bacterium]NIT51963.1 aldehyde dehydrogenase family protein [candidate division Zixibacteria bacterium]